MSDIGDRFRAMADDIRRPGRWHGGCLIKEGGSRCAIGHVMQSEFVPPQLVPFTVVTEGGTFLVKYGRGSTIRHTTPNEVARPMMRLLAKAIGLPVNGGRDKWVADWNDADGQTAENVALTFELAAILADEEARTAQPAAMAGAMVRA